MSSSSSWVWLEDIAGRAESFLNQIDRTTAILVDDGGGGGEGAILSHGRLDELEATEDIVKVITEKHHQSFPYIIKREEYLNQPTTTTISHMEEEKELVVIAGKGTKESSVLHSDEDLINFLNDPTTVVAASTSVAQEEVVEIQAPSLTSVSMHSVVEVEKTGKNEPVVEIQEDSTTINLSANGANFCEQNSSIMDLHRAEEEEENGKKKAGFEEDEVEVIKVDGSMQTEEETSESAHVKEQAELTNRACQNQLNIARDQIAAVKDQLEATLKAKKASEEAVAGLETDLAAKEMVLVKAKSDLKAVESQLICLQETTSSEIISQESKIEKLSQELSGLRTKLSEKTQMLDKAREDLMASQIALSRSEEDHKNYRAKAHKILVAKEALINSLKNHEGTSKDPLLAKAELKQIVEERDLFKQEAECLNTSLISLREECKSLENQLASQSSGMEKIKSETRKALQQESELRSHIEWQLKCASEEVCNLRADLAQQKAKFFTKTLQQPKEPDEGPDKAGQIMVDSASGVASADECAGLHEKVADLTDTLLQRQAALETMTAQRTALALQLERLEKIHASCRPQMPYLVHEEQETTESETESGFGRTFGKRAGSLAVKPSRLSSTRVRLVDKLSVRIGNMLRRYPTATLAYMVVLHFWVLLVLYSSFPDLHM